MKVLAALAILLAARAADAGMVCMEVDHDMSMIEAFAKSGSKTNADAIDADLGWYCVRLDGERLAKRIVPACQAILDRDGDSSPCMPLVAAAGVATLGKHDVFASVVAMTEDPLNSTSDGWTKTALIGAMSDARGAAVIEDEWKAAGRREPKYEKNQSVMIQWSSWRQAAAAALGKTGSTADDAAFLREQAAATKDAHVRDACLAAAKAVDARIPKKP